jgi:hypothetical protein
MRASVRVCVCVHGEEGVEQEEMAQEGQLPPEEGVEQEEMAQEGQLPPEEGIEEDEMAQEGQLPPGEGGCPSHLDQHVQLVGGWREGEEGVARAHHPLVQRRCLQGTHAAETFGDEGLHGLGHRGADKDAAGWGGLGAHGLQDLLHLHNARHVWMRGTRRVHLCMGTCAHSFSMDATCQVKRCRIGGGQGVQRWAKQHTGMGCTAR